jgi:hypothetical protein
MAEDREVRPRELTFHSVLDRFWMLALFGGLIALFTSINSEFSPYFYWPYLVPASIAVIFILTWALWRDAPIRARQAIAAVLVLAGAWLVMGPWLSGFADMDFMPATEASVTAGGIIDQVEAGEVGAIGELIRGAFEAAQVNTVTLTGAGVGGFMLVLSGIGSWLTCRRMAESPAREPSPSYLPRHEEVYGGEPEKAFFM